CPGPREIDSGLALQPPLYALAAERIVLAEQGARPLDIGYWALRDKGFKREKTISKIGEDGVPLADQGDEYRQSLESFVLSLVHHLRRAAFPVHPRSETCTRYCDYRWSCRIAQVKSISKRWDEAPIMRKGFTTENTEVPTP